jgi:hypothetical protein
MKMPAKTHFRMIPKPYLVQEIYPEQYKASGDKFLTQHTLILLLNTLQAVPFKTL